MGNNATLSTLRMAPDPHIVYPLRHFELFEEIGRGGMGVVYKARQRNAGDREVAVKTLLTERSTNERFIRFFLREVRATLNFNHPNVVMAIEADEFEHMPYLAMEFVGGPSLAQILHRRGPLPVPLACHLFAQVARGLRHAHEQGFLHRDVKPSNILLRPDGIAKVCDFGVAGFQGTERPTAFAEPTTCALGTLGYVAPEQASGNKDLTPQVDLYSLGATMHHALFGSVPGPAFPCSFLPNRKKLPASLATLGDALLEPDPGDRPDSTDEVIAELEKHAVEGTFTDLVKDCHETYHGRTITLTDLPPLPKSTVTRKVFLGALAGSLAVPAVYALSRITGGENPPVGERPFEDLAVEEIEPQRNYRLFGREPKLIWGNVGEPHLHIDADTAARAVKVDSLSFMLLKCCDIPFENFNLNVHIVQKKVEGGVGLMFYGEKDGEEVSLESLELIPMGPNHIDLQHVTRRVTGDDRDRERMLVISLDRPLKVGPPADFVFKIEARRGRLHRTFLNGAPVLVHPKDEPARSASPSSATTFGLLLNGKAATFQDASITVW